MIDSEFCHLHLHTEYSLLDGATRIKDLVKRLKEMGMTSCAITDHGVMYGAVVFYKAMIEEGLHPIIGCEVYVAPGSRFEKPQDKSARAYHHLILLAKDNNGLRNLNILVSAGFIEGFYRKPRIDEELLSEHHEGLICLSGCCSGKIPSLILEGKYEEAKKSALWYENVFGKDNYYLEIQANTMSEQAKVNSNLIRMSNETGIPLVATNDCHYLMKDDAKIQDILLCMQTGSRLNDPDRMRMKTDDFYVKSETEMRRFFSNIPEAVSNTGKIASMCHAEYDLKTIHLPQYDIPAGFSDNKAYLRTLTMRGLEERLKLGASADKQVYLDRIEYELSVINGMGYTDYYLIVWDFINYAKSKGIMVGPGRGSGAGSLVAYCIGITGLDPIKYSLVFERFLNSERVSMPDFDIDFCYERRQEVIDYVTQKYGRDRVSQVITFGTLAAKMCIRDVGKVMEVPLSVTDRVAKLVPQGIDVKLKDALEVNRELRELYNTDAKIHEVIDCCLKLEGLPRHPSRHAAGVIISGVPITDIAPLSVHDDAVVEQFEKTEIESIGLLKFDFLALRTLTVIRDTLSYVKKNTGRIIELDKIPLDDPAIFEMLGRGDTVGVFQLESRGMTSFMKELKPSSLEDIIAGISLYRPGPMDQIPKYIECKKDASKITYDHPILEPILNVTYGCMVYQEQVMQIVRDMAGFSMGQSDNIRRAMSKKKRSMMEKYRELFVHGGTDDTGREIRGAMANGVPEKTAEKIFDDVAAFAGYAFNKSHAACYAIVGYYTAYLKYYFPAEFMAANMNSFRSDIGKVSWYISCCSNMGIHVLPPDVNRSEVRFTTEGPMTIRIGLAFLKNVGDSAISALLKDRSVNGKFQSFEDFLQRAVENGLNRTMLESLIFSSACDGFGYNRASMIATVQVEPERIMRIHEREMVGQLSLFEMCDTDSKNKSGVQMTIINEYPDSEKLAREYQTVGLYLSGHPLDPYRSSIERLVNFDMKDFIEADRDKNPEVFNDEKTVIMAGMLTSVKTRVTKSKTQMAVLDLADLYGNYQGVLFGKVFEQYASGLIAGQPYIVVGRRNVRDDESLSLYVSAIFPMPSNEADFVRIENDRFVKESRYGGRKPQVNQTSPAKTTVSKVRITYFGKRTDKEYMSLLHYLAFFNGTLPVEVSFPNDEGVVQLLSRECYVSSDPEVIDCLVNYCKRMEIEFLQ